MATGESSVGVGDSTVATGEGSIALGKESTAIGTHSSAIGESSIAYGEDSSAIGHGAVAEGNGSFAGGADSRAYGKKSAALGDFSTALGHDSTAIGHGSATIADNSVALVAGSIADEDNTVSVGSVGYERRITNLADGVNPHDAVNMGQLRRTEEKLTENISKVGAGAAAMANLQPLDYEHDDKVSVSAAVGNYNGQTAMAVGAYYRPNPKTMFSVSGSFGSGENMIGAGISAKFGKTSEIDRMSEERLKDKIEIFNESNAAHSSEYSLTACDLKHPGYSCHVFRHSCGTKFAMRPKICVWCRMCYATIFILLFQIKSWLSTLDCLILYYRCYSRIRKIFKTMCPNYRQTLSPRVRIKMKSDKCNFEARKKTGKDALVFSVIGFGYDTI